MNTCKDCIAYNKILEDSGECRSSPPTVHARTSTNVSTRTTSQLREISDITHQLNSEFPQVKSHDWCCHWQVAKGLKCQSEELLGKLNIVRQNLISLKSTSLTVNQKRDRVLGEAGNNLDKVIHGLQEFRVLTIMEQK